LRIFQNIYCTLFLRCFSRKEDLTSTLIRERLSIVRRAAKYAARERISHVHCHDPLIGYYYHFFSKIYNSTKYWGYTIHSFGRFVKNYVGIHLQKDDLLPLQKMEMKAKTYAQWIISPTASGMYQMAKEMNIDSVPEKCHVVPHAVNVVLESRESARSRLGLSEDDVLLLAVGRLDPMKRFSLLVEAVSLIPAEKRPRIIVLGEGSEKDKLLALAKERGVHNNFEIRVTDTIGTYLSAADMYISVSSTESFGLANCEAVLAGIPSICTNVGAVPELLQDAVIFVDDDKYMIADRIQQLLASDKQRTKLREQTKIISKKWPGAEEIAKKLEDIYLCCNADQENRWQD